MRCDADAVMYSTTVTTGVAATSLSSPQLQQGSLSAAGVRIRCMWGRMGKEAGREGGMLFLPFASRRPTNERTNHCNCRRRRNDATTLRRQLKLNLGVVHIFISSTKIFHGDEGYTHLLPLWPCHVTSHATHFNRLENMTRRRRRRKLLL